MPPDPAAAKSNYAQSIVIDSSRIREELGYEERVSWHDGIARAISWERANPPARVNPKWVDYAAEDAALAALAGAR